MGGNSLTQKAHDFLIDSDSPWSEYIEWGTVGGTVVFCTLKEMWGKFEEIFTLLPSWLQLITPKNSFLHENCHIFLGARKDREWASSWAYLWRVIITWLEENIRKVELILEDNFPTITQ